MLKIPVPKMPRREARFSTTSRERAKVGRMSFDGFSHQSTSPFRSAAAAVAGSGITTHSTRSKPTTFGPAAQLGAPSRGR